MWTQTFTLKILENKKFNSNVLFLKLLRTEERNFYPRNFTASPILLSTYVNYTSVDDFTKLPSCANNIYDFFGNLVSIIRSEIRSSSLWRRHFHGVRKDSQGRTIKLDKALRTSLLAGTQDILIFVYNARNVTM